MNSERLLCLFLICFLKRDRSIDEKDFGRIQKDRIFEMNKWAEEIKKWKQKKKEVEMKLVLL
jgi:hypothetical protein